METDMRTLFASLLLSLTAFASTARASGWDYYTSTDPMTDEVQEMAIVRLARTSMAIGCFNGRVAGVMTPGEFIGDSRSNGPEDGSIYFAYRVMPEKAVLNRIARLSTKSDSLVLNQEDTTAIALGLLRGMILFELRDYRGSIIRVAYSNERAEDSLRQLSCMQPILPPPPPAPVPEPVAPPAPAPTPAADPAPASILLQKAARTSGIVAAISTLKTAAQIAVKTARAE